MNIRNIGEATAWFEVLQTTTRTQTAMMTLKPGRSSGGHKEGHRNSDQVLLVLEGEVEGEIRDDTITLRKGDVIVIPRAPNTNSPIARPSTRSRLILTRRRNTTQPKKAKPRATVQS